MKWMSLQMPKEIVSDQSSATENYSRFIIEPVSYTHLRAHET